MEVHQTSNQTWSYNNQNDWCCHSSQSQSPVAIMDQYTTPMLDKGILTFTYSTTIDSLFDTGYCIQGNATGVANINGRHFELQQFHFHAHSEHTIDAKHYPLELHFVHQSQSGRLAVIAVLFKIGPEHSGFQELITHLDESPVSEPIDLLSLMPTNKNYYHYLGSLTTPPLEENVEWYVFEEPVSLSESQLSAITHRHNHNHRNIQPLNNRPILKHCI